jgi:hypothetical protein
LDSNIMNGNNRHTDIFRGGAWTTISPYSGCYDAIMYFSQYTYY